MNTDVIIYICLTVIFCTLLYLLLRTSQTQKTIAKQYKQLENSIQQKFSNQFNQFEAYAYLRDRLNLHQGMPYTTHWSASPDFLKIISEHCLQHKPETIVECSSGLSTITLARCCQINTRGKVYSLENGIEYAEKTRNHLTRYTLEDYASVIDAPLQPVNLNNTQFQWYSLENLHINNIDMLVIDGPPGFIQKHSRYPAIPLLFNRLADNCIIFLDDALRPDEKEIVKCWLTEHGELAHEYINTERGCSVFKIKR